MMYNNDIIYILWLFAVLLTKASSLKYFHRSPFLRPAAIADSYPFFPARVYIPIRILIAHGEIKMRTLIFIYLAMLAISCVLLSAGTVDISRESGMDILANLTDISQNQSQNATQNATAANLSSSGAAASSDLWSWGISPWATPWTRTAL